MSNEQHGEDTHADALTGFEEAGLHAGVVRGVVAYGFERPSAFQQRALGPLVAGRDLLAHAQSGTGRTSAFVIAALQRVVEGRAEEGRGEEKNVVKVVVVVPTRELAQATKQMLVSVGRFVRARCHACVGGVRVGGEDERAVGEGCDVVVGSPGRVADLVARRVLCLNAVRLFVLDEADELLARGFSEQLHTLLASLPHHAQRGVFSCTLGDDVVAVAGAWLRDPVRVVDAHSNSQLSLSGIHQFYVAVEREEWKLDTLVDMLEALPITQAVVYCNTRRKVEWLVEQLRARAFRVSGLHGDMDAAACEAEGRDFRCGSSRVLVATDLLARSHHLPAQVTMTINFDVPLNAEHYLGRIGRAGRFGRRGLAVSLATHEDMPLVRGLEQQYNVLIAEMPDDIDQLC